MGWNILKRLIGMNKSGILTKPDIEQLIKNEQLYIQPLLEADQIGEISIDLRVGTDFLALHQGRDAYIDTSEDKIDKRTIKSHFTETRRKVGEHFLLHPNQTILFSTLEYIKLPENIYTILSLRSSYSRLGLTLSTIIQPGYCGCASIELVNSSNTPIKIIVGARIIQARFEWIGNYSNYFNTKRKYTCQVRPVASKANEDLDLMKLNKLSY
jgi:dCTP deaminase